MTPMSDEGIAYTYELISQRAREFRESDDPNPWDNPRHIPNRCAYECYAIAAGWGRPVEYTPIFTPYKCSGSARRPYEYGTLQKEPTAHRRSRFSTFLLAPQIVAGGTAIVCIGFFLGVLLAWLSDVGAEKLCQ